MYWGFWIGLSDQAKEGSWLWDFSGKKVGFTSWKRGEPSGTNQSSGTDQDCVTMFIGDVGGDGSWDDDECSRNVSTSGNKAMGAICELKLGTESNTQDTPIIATISILGVLLLCLCLALAILFACRKRRKTVESIAVETTGTSDTSQQ